MKKKLCKYLIVGLTAVLGLTTFTGCTKEYYTTEEYYNVGSEVITREFTIEADAWKWNEVYNRYEVIFEDIKEIDNDIYKYGSIIGTVFTYRRSLGWIHL